MKSTQLSRSPASPRSISKYQLLPCGTELAAGIRSHHAVASQPQPITEPVLLIFVLVTKRKACPPCHTLSRTAKYSKTDTVAKIHTVLHYAPSPSSNSASFSGGNFVRSEKKCESISTCCSLPLSCSGVMFDVTAICIGFIGWSEKQQRAAALHLCLYHELESTEQVVLGDQELACHGGNVSVLCRPRSGSWGLHEARSGLSTGERVFLHVTRRI